MAKCPFATWDEITGTAGEYLGGPFRIMHHTTERRDYPAQNVCMCASPARLPYVLLQFVGEALQDRDAGGVDPFAPV